jgi:hypothetical protein
MISEIVLFPSSYIIIFFNLNTLIGQEREAFSAMRDLQIRDDLKPMQFAALQHVSQIGKAASDAAEAALTTKVCILYCEYIYIYIYV